MPLAVYTSEKEKRGKKREHQEVVLNDSVAAGGVGADVEMNGEVSINGTAPRAVVNAKEGVVSGRPRPIKKQRMVSASCNSSHHPEIRLDFIGHPWPSARDSPSATTHAPGCLTTLLASTRLLFVFLCLLRAFSFDRIWSCH